MNIRKFIRALARLAAALSSPAWLAAGEVCRGLGPAGMIWLELKQARIGIDDARRARNYPRAELIARIFCKLAWRRFTGAFIRTRVGSVMRMQFAVRDLMQSFVTGDHHG